MKDNEIIVEESPAYEAKAAAAKLQNLASIGENVFFDSIDLLREAFDKALYSQLGFPNFEMWIESLKLDITPNTAKYYVRMSRRIEKLALDRDLLQLVKISKLREILTIDPEEHYNEIMDLIQEAPALTLEQVRARVRQIKYKEHFDVDMSFLTIKIPTSIKSILAEAHEKVKTIEGADVSFGDALEHIVVEWLQDANNVPEPGVSQVFEPAVSSST